MNLDFPPDIQRKARKYGFVFSGKYVIADGIVLSVERADAPPHFAPWLTEDSFVICGGGSKAYVLVPLREANWDIVCAAFQRLAREDDFSLEPDDVAARWEMFSELLSSTPPDDVINPLRVPHFE